MVLLKEVVAIIVVLGGSGMSQLSSSGELETMRLLASISQADCPCSYQKKKKNFDI